MQSEISAHTIAEHYAAWADKGLVQDGRRITLLTDHRKAAAGENIRVWHVYEAVAGGTELCVMGPKPVPGEYLDGVLRTTLPPNGLPYPWQMIYDGVVLPAPGIDTHWEPSSYTFDKIGQHTIQWKVDGLESNVLVITVTD